MIDSITRLDLSLLVCNGLSVRARKLDPKLCIKRRQANLASEIKDEINISCYTEYKEFGPSLIYNNSKIYYKKSYNSYLFKMVGLRRKQKKFTDRDKINYMDSVLVFWTPGSFW